MKHSRARQRLARIDQLSVLQLFQRQRRCVLSDESVDSMQVYKVARRLQAASRRRLALPGRGSRSIGCAALSSRRRPVMAPQISTLYMTVIGNTSPAQKPAARVAMTIEGRGVTTRVCTRWHWILPTSMKVS